MADKLAVLNGEIEVGDRVAVAVGKGRYGDAMRIGEVLEITIVPRSDGSQSDRSEAKLRVDQSSGCHSQKLPYIKTYDTPKRMVKLPRSIGAAEFVADINELLGQQVTAKLDESVVTHGKLLGFGEGGEFEILEDDGFIHHCWPLLHIQARETL